MNEKKGEGHHGSFRDKLTTVSEDGKRVWIYPKKPKGNFYNYRKALSFVLLVIFFIGPFMSYKGDPIFLFDVLERKFIVFGAIFWPQDFHLVVLSLITFIVFIILFTVVYGRLWCGWGCPQTVFMEFFFRQVEYIIEGDYNKQKKLDRQDWNFEKIWKKTLKQIIFYLMAFAIAFTSAAYVFSLETLTSYFADISSHISFIIGLVIFAGAIYFIFAFFREQVCTIACPYGRLQGTLLDDKSMIVAYDYIRGEPRGKQKPSEDNKQSTNGDCIDCQSCVVVCPTGIDIRNGTQLECINCTACVDACDAVMDRINKPRGLIRLDSEKGITEHTHKLWNPRTIAYSVVLVILLGVVSTMMFMRTDFETTILRQRGTLFQKYGEDSYSNIYEIELVNKTRKNHDVEIKLLSPEGEIIMMTDELAVEKGKIGKGKFLVVLKTSQLTSPNIVLTFGLYAEGELIDKYQVTFISPRNLK
jgi:cytochrome c oxidase accessory protein FixG